MNQNPHNEQAPKLFDEAMNNVHRYVSSGDLGLALLWAVQSSELAGEQEAAAVNSVLATVIVECSALIRTSALRCGNILKSHRGLSKAAADSADHLVTINRRNKNEAALATSMLIQGYAQQLNNGIGAFLDKNELYTPASELDSIFDCTNSLLKACDALVEDEDRKLRKSELEVAKTAVSNAKYSLTSFFPKTLSDWEKAEWYCRRAGEIFASTHEATYTDAIADLDAARDALKVKSYKTSSRRIGDALKKLGQ